MKKRIYIAGCGGMLGEAFYEQFKTEYDLKCTDKDVNEKWLSFLDFRDRESYIKDVVEFNPDYLFHIGAYTDLEFCEENKDETPTISGLNSFILFSIFSFDAPYEIISEPLSKSRTSS